MCRSKSKGLGVEGDVKVGGGFGGEDGEVGVVVGFVIGGGEEVVVGWRRDVDEGGVSVYNVGVGGGEGSRVIGEFGDGDVLVWSSVFVLKLREVWDGVGVFGVVGFI